jgi:hypothetical protein
MNNNKKKKTLSRSLINKPGVISVELFLDFISLNNRISQTIDKQVN